MLAEEVIDAKKFAGLESCPCGGKLGYLTHLDRRAEVACIVCHRPAPPSHPLCLDLDRQYAERATKAKIEAARPAAAAGVKGVHYGPPGGEANRELAEMRATVAALTQRVVALETEATMQRQAASRKR